MLRRAVTDWTVDYGEGPGPCTVPHAWRQDVDVRWEGPVVYATTVEVPKNGGWLVFDGVSYGARVFLEGEFASEHFGIWDAFTVPLKGFEGKQVEVRVEVVKNGGATYPVKNVLSGFLPYVFNTFGGIWRDVWICDELPDLEANAPPCRVTVKGTEIFVDKKPFYLRGVLTWGWYPELGHPNPSDEEIRREVKIAKELGFNTIKFCLWVPSHRYFEILEEERMIAWLELPLWDPSPDPAMQEKMFEEMERIVRQYRRHSNIVIWTCGCELSSNTTAEFRKRLYEMVKVLTGAALVKDNSGSSEMYGGDLREYGDFYDFHPYCDLPFYPVVLDSLLIGPREKKPILLGEFNDIDVHRDLPRIKKEQPYWASMDPYLNDQGVRWEPPQLPRVLEESRWADPKTERDRDHSYDLLSKAIHVRRQVHQAVRSRDDIGGYVVTGWRDTPISSSGFLDDWGKHNRFGDCNLNGESELFLVHFRKPPWVRGGNRPGYLDPLNHFTGKVFVQVGIHSQEDLEEPPAWTLVNLWEANDVGSGELATARVAENESRELGIISFEVGERGQYILDVEFGKARGSWVLNVFERPRFEEKSSWALDERCREFDQLSLPGGPNLVAESLSDEVAQALEGGSKAVIAVSGSFTRPAPFWRESVNEFIREGLCEWTANWEALQAISGDKVIDVESLRKRLPSLDSIEVLINRVDTRTYEEAPILIRAKVGKGTLVATTLRPFGGLGAQPYGVMNNPAGAHLLERLIELAEEK